MVQVFLQSVDGSDADRFGSFCLRRRILCQWRFQALAQGIDEQLEYLLIHFRHHKNSKVYNSKLAIAHYNITITTIRAAKPMSYQRTPADFMKDIFITPHTFSDPEHPQHGQYLNLQMKNDLYNDSVYKISGCQFGIMGNKDEEVDIVEMNKCEGGDPMGGLASQLMRRVKEGDELLSCQDFRVLRKSPLNKAGTESVYRVKVYQSPTDVFYTEIHPPTPWKLIKYYLFS